MKQLLLSLTLVVTINTNLFSQANLKLYGYAGKGGATGTLYYGICNDLAPYAITLDGSATFSNTSISPGSHTLQIISSSSNVYKAVLNYDPINGISASFPLLPVGTNTFTAFTKRQSNTGVTPNCNGSFTIVLNGNVPPFTNTWFASGSLITAANNSLTLGNLCAGSYGFYANDNTSCPATGTGSLVGNYTVGTGYFPIDMGTTQCGINTFNLSCNAVCTGSAQLMPMSDADITTTILNGPTSSNGGFGPAPISITNQCGGMINGIVMDATGAQTMCFGVINQPAQLQLQVFTTDATAPNYDNGSYFTSASGGTPAYMYTFNPNTTTNLVAGNYTTCVTDNNGCNTCSVVIINQASATSIIESSSSEFSIYPTLVDNELTIETNQLSTDNLEVHVISIDGKEMEVKFEKTQKQILLFLNQLSGGVYVIKLNTSNSTINKRIIVKH